MALVEKQSVTFLLDAFDIDAGIMNEIIPVDPEVQQSAENAALSPLNSITADEDSQFTSNAPSMEGRFVDIFHPYTNVFPPLIGSVMPLFHLFAYKYIFF